MRAAIALAFISLLACAKIHQRGKVALERNELSGVETEHMTGVFLLENQDTRIYMDASYQRPKRRQPPESVHVWFTVVTPWGFEKEGDPSWVVITDAFRRDWGDLNRNESGVSLSAGGRVRELFSIDVPPLALETIADATSVTFRFGELNVPLAPNDITTIRKLVDTWRTPPTATAPPAIAPPRDIKL